MIFNLLNKIAIPVILLIIGGMIYLTYRVDTLKMFSWVDIIGANDYINLLRSNHFLNEYQLPKWIIYSLPDALWVYSFSYLMLLIWNFKITISNAFWLSIGPFIGVFSELGQLINIVPGTYDPIDLFFIITAIIIAFLPKLIYKNINH